MTDASEGFRPGGDLRVTAAADDAAGQRLIFEQDHVVSAALGSIDQRSEASPSLQGEVDETAAAVQDSPATAALIEVAINLQDLAAKQEALRELFESRLRSDEVQTKALERLHDQVREYKVNFIRQEMQPLLRDLIFCYDFAADEVERANRVGPPPTAQESARAFDHLRQMVADVLAKYDVEPYRSPGPEFDRREQQCVRTVPTTVEDEEKKVAAVGAVGFRQADLIIRKEQVTVYKYNPHGATREARLPADVS